MVWVPKIKRLTLTQEGKHVTVLGFQFFLKYMSEGYAGVSWWYKQVQMSPYLQFHVTHMLNKYIYYHYQMKVRNQDLLLFVVNAGGNHWTLLVRSNHVSYS